MKRRWYAIAATSLAFTGMHSVASADEAFWAAAGEPYKGVTIRGVSESTPPSNYVQEVLAKEFEELTGIEVEFETTAWDNMYTKAIQDMEAGTGIYDFVYIEQDIIYTYLSRDFLVNVSDMLEQKPELASSDFSFDDFTVSEVAAAVPEPRSAALLFAGFVVLAFATSGRHRRR